MAAEFTYVLRHGMRGVGSPSSPHYLDNIAIHVTDVCLPLIDLLRGYGEGLSTLKFCLECPAQLLVALQDTALETSVRALIARRLNRLKSELNSETRPLIRQVIEGDIIANEQALQTLDLIGGDVLGEYRRLIDSGRVEPLIGTFSDVALTAHLSSPGIVKGQLLSAIELVSTSLGRDPAGILLTEAGYTPSMNELLAETSVRYLIVDQQAFDGASAPLQSGSYAPIHSPTGGVALFAEQRNFHRWRSSKDRSHSAAYRRRNVLGDPSWGLETQGDGTNTYNLSEATRAVDSHAVDFVNSRTQESQTVCRRMARQPHHLGSIDLGLRVDVWYEVFQFLRAVIHEVTSEGKLTWSTPGQYLETYPTNQVCWAGPANSRRPLDELMVSRSPALHEYAERIDRLIRVRLELESGDRERVDKALRELFWAQSISEVRDSVQTSSSTYRHHLQCIEEMIAPVERDLPDRLKRRDEMPVARPKPPRVTPQFGPMTIT